MIRIGVIGAGPNAAGHVSYFAQSPRSKVIAVADPDTQRAHTLAEEAGAQPIADYRDFLDQVDAVVVSSPNFLHREHAIACAEAGKHVYCEKPMGLSLNEARLIAGAVNQAGVKSVVGFSPRFDGTVQTMQRVAHSGEIGQVVSVCSRRLMHMEQVQGGWRADHERSGGLLYEINIHELDWMMAIAGDVSSVYARTWAANRKGPRCNDQIWVTLNFANDAVGMHEGSWLCAQPQFYRSVQGTDGGLCTNEWGNELYLARNGENRQTLKPDNHFDLRGHFLDCIEHNASPVADVNWGLKVMTVSEAVLESAATKQLVQL
jgi:predicted dehydrogenase